MFIHILLFLLFATSFLCSIGRCWLFFRYMKEKDSTSEDINVFFYLLALSIIQGTFLGLTIAYGQLLPYRYIMLYFAITYSALFVSSFLFLPLEQKCKFFHTCFFLRIRPRKHLYVVLLLLALSLTGCEARDTIEQVTGIYENIAEKEDDVTTEIEEKGKEISESESNAEETYEASLAAAMQTQATPYTVVHGNVPFFMEEEIKNAYTSYESYGELDTLGRCTAAIASVGQDLMPTTEREAIGQIKPTGWHTVKYSDVIDGNYLYNRCHLIGYQLTGENANEKNLITGTRYLNVEGMLPFENDVAAYVKQTGSHVLYRVSPIFEGENLLASGVLMEAISIEGEGEGLQFCVYIPNVQPNIAIDYATGESWRETTRSEEGLAEEIVGNSNETSIFIVNQNTKKFHLSTCDSVSQMKAKNKQEVESTKEELEEQGYEACKACNP